MEDGRRGRVTSHKQMEQSVPAVAISNCLVRGRKAMDVTRAEDASGLCVKVIGHDVLVVLVLALLDVVVQLDIVA
jgi:hypothetical protein